MTSIVTLVSAQVLGMQPSDIIRYEQENDIFIPCPFESQFIPSIWRINGIDYISATLPSIYTLAPSGLSIKEVHKCLDQTSFQCIDVSGSGLGGQESNVGTLTVIATSGAECMG